MPKPAEYRIHPAETLTDFHAIEDLQRATWGEDDLVTASHLLVVAESGGVVLLARDAANRPAGFVYGFPGYLGRAWLCSHMLAVLPEHRAHGLGEALKRAQRQRASQLGYRLITWTFDPLRAPNAQLNIAKLGAVARRYYPNHYGEMNDPLNRGLPSDRLWVEWWPDRPPAPPGELRPLLSERVRGDGLPEPVYQEGLLPDAAADDPVWRPVREHPQEPLWTAGPALSVAIPAHFETLREAAPELLLAWRFAVRRALGAAFASGYAVVGFQRGTAEAGRYLLAKRATA